MRTIQLIAVSLFLFFSIPAHALSVGEWDYKTITGDLKPTPGCKDKEAAIKQASTGYRFRKYTDLLCKKIAYGWNISEVLDPGEVVCEACEGEYEDQEKYRCYVKNVELKCRIVKRGW